jgi:hypothetical protein
MKMRQILITKDNIGASIKDIRRSSRLSMNKFSWLLEAHGFTRSDSWYCELENKGKINKKVYKRLLAALGSALYARMKDMGVELMAEKENIE